MGSDPSRLPAVWQPLCESCPHSHSSEAPTAPRVRVAHFHRGRLPGRVCPAAHTLFVASLVPQLGLTASPVPVLLGVTRWGSGNPFTVFSVLEGPVGGEHTIAYRLRAV